QKQEGANDRGRDAQDRGPRQDDARVVVAEGQRGEHAGRPQGDDHGLRSAIFWPTCSSSESLPPYVRRRFSSVNAVLTGPAATSRRFSSRTSSKYSGTVCRS